MAGEVYILTDADKRALDRVFRKLRNISGPGVSNTPESVTIRGSVEGQSQLSDAVPGTWCWAKITGNATISTNRWKYAWTEQNRTATGFEDMTSGRSGTTSADFAINSIEANNDGTGTQGNSIDIDGAVFTDNTGLEIQPVEGEPVVRLWFDVASDGTTVPTFEYVNAIDGECA